MAERRRPGELAPGAGPRSRAGLALGLFWLLYPLSDLWASDPTPLGAVLALAGLGVFLWIFLGWAGAGPGPGPVATGVGTAVRGLAVMVAITTALTLLSAPTWALLFAYCAALAGRTMAPRPAAASVVGFAVLATLLGTAGGADLGDAAVLGVSSLSIGFVMLAVGQLVAVNAELAAARAELAAAAVAEERLRFARDLHDLLGHSLSVIALKADLATRLLPARPDAARAETVEVGQVARHALTEVRDAVAGYRRPLLATELAGARVALEAAGIAAEIAEPPAGLSPEVEGVLAWTVREGVTNVIRHSASDRASVAFVPAPGGVSAEVRDEGPARPAGPEDPAHSPGAGHGLAGLRERVDRLAGQVEAGPAAGGGFRLRVTVPGGAGATP